ncbi:MAG: hypothetical protein Metus_1176 [Candidatus Methanosuratincola subterraneus]|uniref:Uncharacterized protein n=1 Tax=Methanosuratincola subterraneus TaxID=2593994 RepID=A0A3S3VC08_METS7|nr:MAG: hypothetical protein Metus_1176 [Candidatus Methanosuratincola subterraneus]
MWGINKIVFYFNRKTIFQINVYMSSLVNKNQNTLNLG